FVVQFATIGIVQDPSWITDPRPVAISSISRLMDASSSAVFARLFHLMSVGVGQQLHPPVGDTGRLATQGDHAITPMVPICRHLTFADSQLEQSRRKTIVRSYRSGRR